MSVLIDPIKRKNFALLAKIIISAVSLPALFFSCFFGRGYCARTFVVFAPLLVITWSFGYLSKRRISMAVFASLLSVYTALVGIVWAMTPGASILFD